MFPIISLEDETGKGRSLEKKRLGKGGARERGKPGKAVSGPGEIRNGGGLGKAALGKGTARERKHSEEKSLVKRTPSAGGAGRTRQTETVTANPAGRSWHRQRMCAGERWKKRESIVNRRSGKLHRTKRPAVGTTRLRKGEGTGGSGGPSRTCCALRDDKVKHSGRIGTGIEHSGRSTGCAG